MSSYVLDKDGIDLLAQATGAMLEMQRRYAASYPLNGDTVALLGAYTDDLHNLYRALYITNIKAVNGRYGEDTKTLPKYTPLHRWDTERLQPDLLRRAAETFSEYLYQCTEDPVYGGRAFNAFCDIYKLLCMVIVSRGF